LPRWTAVLLILAPIVFIMGQGGDESIAAWQINIMYPLSCLLYLAAFAPIGWRYLTQPAGSVVGEVGGSTAVA
jgi:uncharacterized membrane protein YtjA (UPF0391 family)